MTQKELLEIKIKLLVENKRIHHALNVKNKVNNKRSINEPAVSLASFSFHCTHAIVTMSCKVSAVAIN